LALDREREYFTRVEAIYGSDRADGDSGRPGARRLFWAMDQLNTKASGLLQHVSIMIAALSFLSVGAAANPAEQQWLIGELVGYSFVAAATTRCLFATSPNLFSGDHVARNHEMMLKVYRGRRRTYLFVWWANLVLVAAVFVTLLAANYGPTLGDVLEGLLSRASFDALGLPH